MQSVGYAALEVIPSLKGFEGKLTGQTNPILTKSGLAGGTKFGDAAGKSMSSRFVSHAKSAALLAGGVLTGVVAVGVKIGKDSIAEAREAQRAGAVTRQVIKSTGAAANVSAGQIGKLSTAISNRVGIDDEAIQSGANLLLTFKQIQDQAGKGNKVFDQATKITTDMAVAMAGGKGGEPDLKSSAILVGKALNDPTKGLTALTRVGVTFNDQQTKQIKSLDAQGKTMQAQKIILKELRSEFGGTAAAQATMGDKVKVAWGNVEENLGTALLPLLDDVEHAFLNKGVPALNKFSNWFEKDGTKGIEGFIKEAEPLAESILPAAKNGLKDIAGFLKDAAPKAKAVIDAFNQLPSWAQKAVVVGGAAGLLGKKTGVLSFGSKALTGGSGTSGSLLGLVSKSKPLPVFVTNPGFGAGGGVLGDVGKAGFLGSVGTVAGGVALGAGLLIGGDELSKALNASPLTSLPALLGVAVEEKRGIEKLGDFFFHHKSNGPLQTPDAIQAGIDLRRADIPKIRSTTGSVDALNASLATTSRSLDLIGGKGGKSFADLTHNGGEYKALLDKLPKKVQTAIQTPGLIDSRRDLLDLNRHFKLTPRQVSTEFRLTGIDRARREFDALQAHMGRHQSFEQNIELAGRGPAQTALDGVKRH